MPKATIRRFVRSLRPTTPGGRVRLRTLILIRWVAIVGQLFAILFVGFSLGFPVPLVPVLAVVAASELVNIWIQRRRRGTMRIGNRQIAYSLGFDLLQLSGLLYLTGGLNNPCAILILAPVIVSATILHLVFSGKNLALRGRVSDDRATGGGDEARHRGSKQHGAQHLEFTIIVGQAFRLLV